MSPTVKIREQLALATPRGCVPPGPRGPVCHGELPSVGTDHQLALASSTPTQLSSEESKPVSCSPGKGQMKKTADGLETVGNPGISP